MKNHSLKTGLSFGLTSGIITTLGLIVGLHSSTQSEFAVIGGILVIAIADAFSDALGIHFSEESENVHTDKEVWESTIFTFIFKFICALSFIIPILLFEFSLAIIISVIYGLILLGILSFYIARKQKKTKAWKAVIEHLIIAIVVVIITHFIGDWVALTFS
ncbi:MAG: VIT1/CCC1 transporter family protein [Candidatus Helarchaeota archaeon]